MEDFPVFVWLESTRHIQPIDRRAVSQEEAMRKAAGWWQPGTDLSCQLVDAEVMFWLVWAQDDWEPFNEFLETEAGRRLGIEPSFPAPTF